jgi:hypothetical protein
VTFVASLLPLGEGAYRECVRAHGRLSEAPDAGAADHFCWVYDDDRDLGTAVGRFLSGGLARGERLLVVGDGIIETLHRDTLPFGGADALFASGALATLSVAEAYDGSGQFTPEQQLAFYGAATQKAIDDGYTGLRVAADGSALAADPASRPALVRWEHMADDFVAQGSGFTAMCAYRGDLSPEALADVASVHPLVRGPDGVPPFHVFHDEQRVVLTGSVDTCTADRLGRVLAVSPAARPVAVLDLGHLDFVDVAGCRVLARWAQELEGPLEVRGASRLLQRMWRLLSLDQVAPVTFAEPAA